MDAKLEYMNWMKNRYISEEDLKYLKTIIDDDDKIEELFGTDLTFEGNKIEGKFGLGTAYMNNYQISRAVQAFSSHMIRKAGGRVGGSVAIGYDSRKFSKEWAESVARMLLGNGIGTSIFLGPKATVQVPFAIQYLKLEGGLMVTADSDDPDMYGLKFFDGTGAPMSEEDMEGISLGFASIHTQSQMKPYVGVLRINSIHRKIGPANDYKFMKTIFDQADSDLNKDLKIAYSPLYGAGTEFVPEMFKEAGFKKFYAVKEESAFNGDFPGLERPDPSDERVYEKVLEKAREKDADLALVTNPNLMEFGAAVKTGEGEYRILTQEEIQAELEAYQADRGETEWIPGPGALYRFAALMAQRKNG